MGGSGSGGRNRRSNAVHRLRGTFRQDRHAGVDPLPAAPPLSLDPPAHLVGEARAFWVDLAPKLVRAGLLTELDVPKLELLCIHLGHHRRLYVSLNAILAKGEASGTPVDTSRVTRSLRQQADTIKSLSAGFGLDPGDRARVHVAPPTVDAFDAYRDLRPPSKWVGILP